MNIQVRGALRSRRRLTELGGSAERIRAVEVALHIVGIRLCFAIGKRATYRLWFAGAVSNGIKQTEEGPAEAQSACKFRVHQACNQNAKQDCGEVLQSILVGTCCERGQTIHRAASGLWRYVRCVQLNILAALLLSATTFSAYTT